MSTLFKFEKVLRDCFNSNCFVLYEKNYTEGAMVQKKDNVMWVYLVILPVFTHQKII